MVSSRLVLHTMEVLMVLVLVHAFNTGAMSFNSFIEQCTQFSGKPPLFIESMILAIFPWYFCPCFLSQWTAGIFAASALSARVLPTAAAP